MSEDESKPIIVDHGSANLRVGWAGQEGPQETIACLSGSLKEGKAPPVSGKSTYVGSEAQEYRDLLHLEYPIVGGVVEDWDAMDRIYDHMFSKSLGIADAAGRKVLFSERPLNDKKNREELAQLMFESYSLGSMYVANSAILVLYASSRSTGVIVDIGDGCTTVVPCYEGFTPPKSEQRRERAGRDLTRALQDSMLNSGIPLDLASAQEFKEKFCFVAMDDEDRSSCIPKTFELPSGQSMTMAAQRHEVPEMLFNDKETCVHGALWAAIHKCNRDMRKDLLANIIITGGTSRLSNFPERLERELKDKTKCPKGARVNFDVNPARHLATWFGGSILAELGDFEKNWVSKAEFEERGPSVVHRIQRR